MGCRSKAEVGGKQCIAAVFSPPGAKTCHIAPTKVIVGTVIGDNEEDVILGIKRRSQLTEHVASANPGVRAEVTTIGG